MVFTVLCIYYVVNFPAVNIPRPGMAQRPSRILFTFPKLM